jgi:hypothetical protein
MNMAIAQKVDLYQPIVANRVGAPPLALRVGVTPSVESTAGGTQQSSMKVETYVLLSALPTELQERVKLALQALIAAG